MLKRGCNIGIVGCSNGQDISNKEKIDYLVDTLKSIGLNPICSEFIYEKKSVFSRTGEQRAKALMDFYLDANIMAIFDISGGDLANELLCYLDFDIIKRNPKPFFGYSDLTTIVNAIYQKTGSYSYLYQIRNLIYKDKKEQLSNFCNSIFYNKNDLFNIKYNFVKGSSLEGVIVGGNIRCLLKLAGTPYWPNMEAKILFLEGFGGEVCQMTTYLNQLKQIGVFKQINGILLGTFSKMEANLCYPTMESLVLEIAPDIPIVKTYDIGHGTNSKCLIIGKYMTLLSK